jgi:sugar lactone lactonase YvrE
MNDANVEEVWLTGASSGESPVWDAAQGRIWFADIRDGHIYCCDPDGNDRQSWAMPERVGSFGLCRSGRLVVALRRRVALFDVESETFEALTAELPEPAGNRFNDGKVGPDGSFWVGSRDGRRDAGDVPDGNGRLYRVRPDGTMTGFGGGYATSNGLAWSADGRTMFHSDSHNGRLDVWDFDPERGEPSNRRSVARLSQSEGRPDGGACDADGYYWSAGISNGRLNRFTSTGEVVESIALPIPAPTMPCFGDKWLFVTANRRDASDPRFTNLAAGLFRMPARAAGAEVGLFAD